MKLIFLHVGIPLWLSAQQIAIEKKRLTAIAGSIQGSRIYASLPSDEMNTFIGSNKSLQQTPLRISSKDNPLLRIFKGLQFILDHFHYALNKTRKQHKNLSIT